MCPKRNGDESVERKYRKTAVLLAVIGMMAGLASCSREVPSNTDTTTDFTVVGDSYDNTGGSDDKLQLKPRTTAKAEYTETPDSETTPTSVNVSLVTRSKEELDRINGNKKPTATAKPTGGSKVTAKVTKNVTSTNARTSDVQATTPTTSVPTAPSISLSYTSAEIIVGQTKQYPLVQTYVPSEIWTTSDANVATVDQYGNITGVGEGSCIIRVTNANDTNAYGEVAVTVVNPPQGIQQIDGVTYADGVLIANKSYALPSTYNPGGLTNETYNAFQSLVQGASNDGISIFLSSGFRSYETQEQIYNNYVDTHGQATADTFSARPGHSEHQTGLAIDVNEISDAFIGTPEAVWLEKHCVEYGFIIRYPKGKQNITGYKYEPWHIRYVGVEMAQKIRDAGIAIGDPYYSMEEYFGITSQY